MSINRPGEYRPLQSHRIDPLERGRNEDEREKSKKKKVSYKGRSWREEEEELPVQPPPHSPLESREEKKGRNLYADQVLLEKAEKALSQIVTIEEKIAQLCFLYTEAFYESQIQKEIEFLILKFEIGGLLFTKGEFRRQLYLIERYQSLTKIPLLIGNDFLHGLSFYFQGEVPFEKLEKMDERKSSDLGKAVVFQNKKLGVHFQFDSERISKLKENLARSFRHGIREAQGVVAREKTHRKMEPKRIESSPNPLIQFVKNGENIQEAFGLRTLQFIDLTLSESFEHEKMIEFFEGSGDAFLLKGNIEEFILLVSDLIRKGKVKETDLDKKVTKILLLKKV